MKKNISLLLLVHCSNYLFPLLVLPYQMRVLSVDNFANLMLIQSIVMMLSLVVNFGYNFSATKAISTAKSKFDIDKIYSDTISSKLLLCTIVIIISSVIIYSFFSKEIIIPLFISFIYLIGNVFFSTWLFQGLERMKGIVLATSIAKTIAIGLTFFIVKEETDLNNAIFSQNLGMFLSGLISLLYVKYTKMASFILPEVSSVYKCIKKSLPYFLSIAATSLYTYMNIVIVSVFCNSGDVANFAAADKLRMAVQAMLVPISQAVYPRVNKSMDGERAKLVLYYGKPFAIFGFFLSLTIMIFGEWLSLIYFGDGYSNASKIFNFMFPLPFVISLSIILSQWILMPFNREKTLSKIYMFGAFMHVIFSIILVEFFGIQGMITAILITEITIVILMYRKARCYLWL